MPRLADDLRLPLDWDTAAAALTACARALGDRREVRQIAADSGLAFRVSVDDQVSLAGPHAYPWREVLPACAERLGYQCRVRASNEPPGSALFAAAQARAFELCREGVAAGRPTLLWGVHAPEFGLVRGVEGDVLEVSGILDGAAPSTMPRDQLGRGDVPVVFALQLVAGAPLPPDEAARAALGAALAFARGPTPTLSGVHAGLAAWRALDGALERGTFDPSGLAYAAQRWAHARACAAAALDGWAAALALDLDAAKGAYRRAAAMLAELAACHPFPPPPSLMLTSTHRDQAQALVAEVARAESDGAAAIEAALRTLEGRRLAQLRVMPVDEPPADLFGCADELGADDLAPERAACRDRLGAPARGFRLTDGTRTLGHALYAPLADAHAPVVAAGRRWFVFCTFVARELRGRGAEAQLLAAVEDAARQAGVDGLLALATDDPRYLYADDLLAAGFVEVARRGGLLLCERALGETPSLARMIDPPPAPPRTGALPVMVRHGYHCPLQLRARRDLCAAARAAGDAVALDERDADAQAPEGAFVDGQPLPLLPLSAPQLARALAQALDGRLTPPRTENT